MAKDRKISPQLDLREARYALLRDLDGACFEIRVSAGCEIFIGHYVRMAPLDPGSGLIAFADTSVS